MSVWSDATDGWDDGLEFLIAPFAEGYAGVYHEQGQAGWGGPTGFYRTDFRAPPSVDETKIWEPIHVWADPSFADPIMYFSMEAHPDLPAPADRDYFVQLLYVPEDVVGAPPVGAVWPLPEKGVLAIPVPTYRTDNGKKGYRFSFTATEVIPEPGSAALLAIGGLVCLKRRSRDG